MALRRRRLLWADCDITTSADTRAGHKKRRMPPASEEAQNRLVSYPPRGCNAIHPSFAGTSYVCFTSKTYDMSHMIHDGAGIYRILLKGFVHFLYSPLEASVHHGRSLPGRTCQPGSQAVTSQPLPPPPSAAPPPRRSRRVVFPSPLVRAREVAVVVLRWGDYV